MKNKNNSKIRRMIVIIACVLLAVWILNSLVEWSNSRGVKKLGITFSPRYAGELNLNPRETYLTMLSDLNPKYLRLPVYWDEVEKIRGEYNFSEVDWYIKQARDKGVEINLVLGYKQPRWPECFAPQWAEDLPIDEFSNQVLRLVNAEVNHFKKYDNIRRWQIENEPNLPFGYCYKPDPARLSKEIEIIRSSDKREVVITESGELSDWADAMRKADGVGVSVYRTVWNPWIGLVDYPLPATFYSVKNLWDSLLSWRNPQKTYVAELQTEPWGTNSRSLQDIPTSELKQLFPPDRISRNLNYAKKIGFDEIYLWGVEWWYMMKEQGEADYIDNAKKIFVN